MGPDAGHLTQLPMPEPKQNRLSIHGTLDCTHGADAVPVRLKVVAEGYPDYELRAAARQWRTEDGPVPLVGVSYRPVAGLFSLEEQTATAVDALNEAFTWNGQEPAPESVRLRKRIGDCTRRFGSPRNGIWRCTGACRAFFEQGISVKFG